MTEVLDGVCASGWFEAQLGREKFGKEVHTFSSALTQSNIDRVSLYSDYVAFNSVQQWKNFHSISLLHNCAVGVRVNPAYSERLSFNVDPCHESTRFGLSPHDLSHLCADGIAFVLVHNMCGQFTNTLKRSLDIVTEKFSKYLETIKHINLGGGQLYTHSNYNISDAITSINKLQESFGISVYIEPGEAVMLDSSYLVTSIVDIVDNGMKTAILDASAICHMPDIIFSKYPCEIMNSYAKKDKPHSYRLAGCSCYAGDIFGDYSFVEPLSVGDKIVIKDSVNYTTVKSNMFNGINYPSLVFYSSTKGYELIKNYNYDTYISIL